MIYTREFIKEIKSKISMVELASEFTELERESNGVWKGKCPKPDRHDNGEDRNPSFAVWEENNSFHCFTCGAGRKGSDAPSSDIISFIMWVKEMNFVEAVQWLARKANLNAQLYIDHHSEEKKKLYQENEVLAETFHKCLLDHPPTMTYLIKDRGINKESIVRWKLGKVPNESAFGINRGRLSFPVCDRLGRIAGFGFRRLDDAGPKYRNSNESMIWIKGANLYGLHMLEEKSYDSIILCEGFTDVILLHQYGVNNALACMGTSLTDAQVQMLASLTKEIIIFIDGDRPGESAASRHIMRLRDYKLDVSVVPVSKGVDPADQCLQYLHKIKQYIDENTVRWLDYEIGKVMAQYYSQWGKIKTEAMYKLSPIFSLMDGLEKDMYINNIKDLLEARPWYDKYKDSLAIGVRNLTQVR